MTDLILQPMPLAESTYTFPDEGERLSTAYIGPVLRCLSKAAHRPQPV